MKMNLYHFAFITTLFIVSCNDKKEGSEHHHDSKSSTPMVKEDTVKKSIPKEAHGQIGNVHVMIKYHAPAVRGRTIWGGLVPYGEVWVTGAHNATSFEIDRDIMVNGEEISAGKYALFTIPRQDQWTIIINKNWDQHLADEYDEKEDVIRLDVSPEQNAQVQERLKYEITSGGSTNGAVLVSWEKVRIAMPFKVK